MLHQSATRSHISVTSLLSGEVCCSNHEASLFCHTGAAEWILTALYSLCRAALSALCTFIISLSSHRDLETLVTAGSTLIVPAATVACTTTRCIGHENTNDAVGYLSFFFQNPKQTQWEHHFPAVGSN